MKYTLTLEFLFHTSVEVEADSKEEAINKINEMEPDEIFGGDSIPIWELKDLQVIDAEENEDKNEN